MTFKIGMNMIAECMDLYGQEIISGKQTRTDVFLDYFDEDTQQELIALLAVIYYGEYLWTADIYQININEPSSSAENQKAMYEPIVSLIEEMEVDDFVELVTSHPDILALLMSLPQDESYFEKMQAALHTEQGRTVYQKYHPSFDTELKQYCNWKKKEDFLCCVECFPIENYIYLYYLMMLSKNFDIREDEIIRLLYDKIEDMEETNPSERLELLKTISLQYYALVKTKELNNKPIGITDKWLLCDFETYSKEELLVLIEEDMNTKRHMLETVFRDFQLISFPEDTAIAREHTVQYAKKIHIEKACY